MALPLILGLGSLFASGASAISGISQKNKAKKALENLQTPNHENPAENIRVSTMGSDLVREEGQRRTANILDSLQGGSASTMLSALPSLVAMNNQINQQAALDIDKQMINREYQIAQYEGRLNEIEEQRYQSDIQGLGAMYNQGQHQMWNGIRGGIAGIGSLARGISDGTYSTSLFGEKKDQDAAKSTTQPSYQREIDSSINNYDFSNPINYINNQPVDYLPNYAMVNS